LTDIFPVDFAKQHHYYLPGIFTIFKIGIRPDKRRAHLTLAGVLLSSLNTGSISGIFAILSEGFGI